MGKPLLLQSQSTQTVELRMVLLDNTRTPRRPVGSGCWAGRASAAGCTGTSAEADGFSLAEVACEHRRCIALAAHRGELRNIVCEISAVLPDRSRGSVPHT